MTLASESYLCAHPFERLLRINQANNQALFLGGFCHSFKNPINSIHMASRLLCGYVQDINNRFDDSTVDQEWLQPGSRLELFDTLDAIPQVVQGISDSALKLNRLVSSLSELSGSGAVGGDSDVDINWLIPHCIAMVKHEITRYTNSFRLTLENDLPPVPGNALQISQVILNLTINAFLSLPERSRGVVISASSNHDDGCVRICVRDEGVGIAPKIFTRMYEPFFTAWPEHGCIGLGLTVADRIVINHRGTLSVESEPGKGTAVFVSLPVK